MTGDRDPSQILGELRWLGRRDEVLKAWKVEEIEPNYYEFYEFINTMFDNYLIKDAEEIYNINHEQAYYVRNISCFLDRVIDVYDGDINIKEFCINPDFLIAQKICELL